MLEEMGGKRWCPPRPRPPFPAENHRVTECSGLEGTSVGHLETLPWRGAVAGRVEGLSPTLVFLWSVALDHSEQICSPITHPDAELAPRGTPFPRERLLEQGLWGCVRSPAPRDRGKDNPESFITRTGPLESLLGSRKTLGVGLRTCCDAEDSL